MIYEHDDVISFILQRSTCILEDVPLARQMPTFRRSGLKRDSVIKLNKLATLDKSLLEGEFGEIDHDLLEEVQRRLREMFGPQDISSLRSQ